MATTARNEGRFRDELDRLVPIFSDIDAELVFVACLDSGERVTECEFFGSHEQPKNTLPVDELFVLARRLRSPGVLVATRAAGPIGELHDCDVDFARRVKATGDHLGVPVVAHYLIGDGRHRLLTDEDLRA